MNGNDLRQRYAEALARSFSPHTGFADHVDAVMAVRDEELERLRRELYVRTVSSKGLHEAADRAAAFGQEQNRRAEQAEATVARVAAFRDYLATATADTETGALLLKVADSLRDVLDGEHVPAARRWTEEELAEARARGRQRAAAMEDLFDDGEPLAVSEEQTGSGND